MVNTICAPMPQNEMFCGTRLLGKMLFSSKRLEILDTLSAFTSEKI